VPSTNPPAATAKATPSDGGGRRRPPSAKEQKRRVEWGRKWGPLVREATKHLREAR